MGGAASRYAYAESSLPVEAVGAPAVRRLPPSVDLRSGLCPHTVRRQHEISSALAVVTTFLNEADLNGYDVAVPATHALSARAGECPNVADVVATLNAGVPAEGDDEDDAAADDDGAAAASNAHLRSTLRALEHVDVATLKAWLSQQRSVIVVVSITDETADDGAWRAGGEVVGRAAGVLAGYNEYDETFLLLEASVSDDGVLLVPFDGVDRIGAAYVLDVSTVDEGPLFVADE